MTSRDAERIAVPRWVVEAWAGLPPRPLPPPDWRCPTCQAERSREDVRLVIQGHAALHCCRQCGTVLDCEDLPF